MRFRDYYAKAEEQHKNAGYANPTPQTIDVRALYRQNRIYIAFEQVRILARAANLPLSDV